jgi:hypothetical protein
MNECDTPKLTARDPRNRSYKRSGAVPQAAPPPDPPFALHFWIPGLLLGVVSVSAAVSHWMRKRDERFWAAMSDDVDDELARHQAFMARQSLAQLRHPSIRAALRELRSKDDAFSFVLFEDFLHALYVEANTLRGLGKLALLRPYFRQEALASLAGLPQLPVTGVIVGSTETLEITTVEAAREVRVTVGFEANYTEGTQSYAVREVWTLARGADIVSRPPERARVIGCANCGGPLDKLVGDTCEHCGAPSAPGSRDWQVVAIEIQARESRPPQLTGTTEEQGTSLPTLTAPDLKGEFGALAVRDPEFSWAAFVARVEHVFHTFHEAWVAQDLAPVRPFFSDQLFEAQRYWVGAYRAQQLRNVTEDRQLVSIALSRILHDKYFDAITVRVFAQCKDFTLDLGGDVVGGSRDEIRRYTEYWTFIRSAEKRGASKQDPGCPNCGAPIAQINMAGDCASCQAHVTTGEFDWVLSRIEQDEVYRL